MIPAKSTTSSHLIPSKYLLMKVSSPLNISTFFISELDEVDVLEAHYQITELSSDYLNSSSSIRDFRSRVISIQFQLSCLSLDHKSKDKFLRLIGLDRYDEETDLVLY